MNTTKNISSELKEVIERNVDAMKGYEKAADKVKNPELASAFRKQASQRKRFALELENAAGVFSAEDREKIEKGTFSGNLHRTWMDLKTAFSSDKDESVVEECIRGEKQAVENYDELLGDTSITSPSRELITDQRNTVQTCIQELKQLERLLD